MKRICKTEAFNEDGEKIMQFTKGKAYYFDVIFDPKGWEVLDDNDNIEHFFDLDIMFE